MAFRAIASLLASAVLASSDLFGQIAKNDARETEAKWQPIDQLCAQLEFSAPKKKQIVVNGKHETRLYTAHLERATVSLYSRISDEDHCCKGRPVATTQSGRYGRFESKGTQRGDYWLEIQKDGLLRAIPVRVTDDFDARRCQDHSVVRSVVVDSDPPKIETRIR